MTDGSLSPDAQRARQIFDLHAVVYRAEPSDEHFRDLLLAARPTDSGTGLLTDVLYEVAARPTDPLRVAAVVHLLQVLVESDRWLEALHFCRQWVQQEPESIEAHELAVEVACRCFDMHEAHAMLEALEHLGAAKVRVDHSELAYRLTFCNAQGAREVVQRLLSTARMDPRTAMLAVDAALRLEDPLLLAEVLMEHPNALAPGAAGLAKRLLGDRILKVLGARARAGER